MPWKETSPVEERMRFVTRLREGERLVDLCLEYGISRKTGAKIKKRYSEEGVKGLEDRSRAPSQIPHQTPPEIRALIVAAKKKHMTWGPKKVRAWLADKHPGLCFPSPVTCGNWLERAGLVKKRGSRRRASATLKPSELTEPKAPNDVWAVDFKGQFRLGNGSYCYPLTITDQFSRLLVGVVALDSTKMAPARAAFEDVFREFGLPRVIRSDNGTPFASTGLAGLTVLSTYWLRLGIRPERIEPGHPEQNGQHERMHRTLKEDTTRPAGRTMLQQQERFDAFREEFNNERPHEAIGQRPPAKLYLPSKRAYPSVLPPVEYPLHDVSRGVSFGGCFSMSGALCFLSHALTHERVGLREIDDGRWLVSFMHVDLGHYDERTNRFEPSSEVTL